MGDGHYSIRGKDSIKEGMDTLKGGNGRTLYKGGWTVDKRGQVCYKGGCTLYKGRGGTYTECVNFPEGYLIRGGVYYSLLTFRKRLFAGLIWQIVAYLPD